MPSRHSESSAAAPRNRLDRLSQEAARARPAGKRSGRPEAAASWGGNVQEQGDWMRFPWTAEPHAGRNIPTFRKVSIDKLSQGPRRPIRKDGRPEAAISWGGNVQEQGDSMRLPWTAKPHAGRNIAKSRKGSIDKLSQGPSVDTAAPDVMAGLVPAIHARAQWMAGTSPLLSGLAFDAGRARRSPPSAMPPPIVMPRPPDQVRG